MNAVTQRRPGLLVDDDPLYLRTLRRSLRRHGIETAVAATKAEAIAHRPEGGFEFALVDLRLERESGLDLIDPLRRAHPGIRIILVTGYASVATAVEAIKRGADNYLPKPATVQMILKALASDGMAGEPVEVEATMLPLNRVEWEHIQQALNECDGNISAAARLLGMHRRSLQRKLAKRPAPQRRVDERH